MNWKLTLRQFAQRFHEHKLLQGIDRILSAQEAQLTDAEWLLGLIRQIGLRYDRRGIYGSEAKYMNFLGPGLWQIPRQFAEALLALGKLRPADLLEIGTCDGWSCCVMTAYLSRFNPNFKALTIDPINHFSVYDKVRAILPIEFRLVTSDDLKETPFDLCFIDGDHSMEWVSRDYQQVGKNSRLCMFHDINDAKAGGGAVRAFWRELKSASIGGETFLEFIAHPDHAEVMGIGVVVKEGG